MSDNIFHVTLENALRISDRVSYGHAEGSIPMVEQHHKDNQVTLLFESTHEDGSHENKQLILDISQTIKVNIKTGLAVVIDITGKQHGLYFKKVRSINADDL